MLPQVKGGEVVEIKERRKASIVQFYSSRSYELLAYHQDRLLSSICILFQSCDFKDPEQQFEVEYYIYVVLFIISVQLF